LLSYGLALQAAGRREEARPVLLAAAAALDRNRPAQARLAAQATAEVTRLSQR
jgi:hypothetical protein